MEYREELRWGRLLRRWKRFLAEVEFGDGRRVVAHVPNSGAMLGCADPGSPVLVAPAAGPGRKLDWRLEQVIAGGIPVGVNTQLANGLALEALASGLLEFPGLRGPWQADREVRCGSGNRLDFRLTGSGGTVWVEVKNVTWAKNGIALFPDAATARGARHLDLLTGIVRAGGSAALVYVVQRGDARAVQAADRVDPAYAAALHRARESGVIVRAVQVVVAPHRLVPWRVIPVPE